MKKVVVDIDGVIADEANPGDVYSYSVGWAYEKCIVLEEGRQLLKALKERGYVVILHTARSTKYPENVEKTDSWLEEHGLDELVDGVLYDKPSASLYIDDRGFRWTGKTREVEEILGLLDKNC